MRSTINSGSIYRQNDISRISHSRISILDHDYRKLESEIKKVQYPTFAISNAEDLAKKVNSFHNQKVKYKLNQKLTQVNSYRKVRGDGNCFFRALAFSYISSKKNPTFDDCFSYINELSLTGCFSQSIPKQFSKFYNSSFLQKVLKQNWDRKYKQCYQSSQKISLKALLKLFTQFPYLDFIVILYFRSLCLKAFCKFQKDFKEFLDGSQEKGIRTYGQQTEGVAIELCSKMLDIKIHVFEVRKDEVHLYSYINVEKQITSIYLLFSDNHYDIMEKNDNIEAEGSVLKEKNDYYTSVDEKMKEGICLQCGTTNPVYLESGLCFRCHQASLNTLQNLSKTDRFVKGKCGQCYKIKDTISQALGLCKDCIQYQNYLQNKRKEDQENKTHYGRCLICKYPGHVFVETGICRYCKKQQKMAIQKNEDNKKKEVEIEQSRKSRIMGNQRKQLLSAKCISCLYMTTVSSQTSLCRECENNQRRLMERISPNKKKSHPEFNDKGQCKVCKFKQKLNSNTGLCQGCTSKQVVSIKKRICKICKVDFSDHKTMFNQENQVCQKCFQNRRKEKSYEESKCKKCQKINISGPLEEGMCRNCKINSSRFF